MPSLLAKMVRTLPLLLGISESVPGIAFSIRLDRRIWPAALLTPWSSSAKPAILPPTRGFDTMKISTLRAACCLLGFLLAIANPVAAQPAEQTVEAAQRFLAIQFDRGMATSSTQTDQPGVIRGRVIASRARPDRCTSGYVWQDQSGGSGPGEEDWPNIVSVQHQGSTVLTTRSVPQQTMVTTYEIGSTDLASRVAYAMEFLRQACDPSANTGF